MCGGRIISCVNYKSAINVISLNFHKKLEADGEKKSLDTGGLKQLVENYAQENTDLVTCLKDSPFDPVLHNSFLGAWFEVNDLLITFRDLGPLCGSTSSIYTRYRKDRGRTASGLSPAQTMSQ